MDKDIIEHIRDGEVFEQVKLSSSMFKQYKDRTFHIVLPAGLIELATGDILRFDPVGLFEILNDVILEP